MNAHYESLRFDAHYHLRPRLTNVRWQIFCIRRFMMSSVTRKLFKVTDCIQWAVQFDCIHYYRKPFIAGCYLPEYGCLDW